MAGRSFNLQGLDRSHDQSLIQKESEPHTPGRRTSLAMDEADFTEEFLIRLSPRSKEACKRCGVVTKELLVKPYESFASPGLPSTIQKLRYQDYEQLRQETLGEVREERERLVEEGWFPGTHSRRPITAISPTRSPQSSSPTSSSPLRRHASQSSLSSSHPSTSTLLAMPQDDGGQPTSTNEMLMMEQQRLERMMVRQNKELEAMMQYELRIASMINKHEAKMAAKREQEEQEQQKRREERQKMEEKRRQWEQQKLMEEQQETLEKYKQQQRFYEQQQKFLDEQRKREEERKREARKRQDQRRVKKMMAEEKQKQEVEHQFDLMCAKEREMQEREEKRKQMMEERKKQLHHMMLERTLRARSRVQAAIQASEKTLADKKDQMLKRLTHHSERMDHFEKMKDELAKEKEQLAMERENKRKEIIKVVQGQAQSKVNELMEKSVKHDQLKAEMDAKIHEQINVRKEMRRLNNDRKHLNVERLKRKMEYEKMMLAEKLADDERRAREIEEQRQQLLLERQRNKKQIRIQKHNIMTLFNKIKTNKQLQQTLIDSSEDHSEEVAPSNAVAAALRGSRSESNLDLNMQNVQKLLGGLVIGHHASRPSTSSAQIGLRRSQTSSDLMYNNLMRASSAKLRSGEEKEPTRTLGKSPSAYFS